MKNFFLISKRILLVVLLSYITYSLIFDYPAAVDMKNRLTLNRLRVDSYDVLFAIRENPDTINSQQLTRLKKYFKTITEYYPEKNDAFSLLGFCEFYSGHTDEAISAYKKSISINPYFFWSWYNLGIIYLKAGNFEEAKNSFQKALKTKRDSTLQTVRLSTMLYNPIVRYRGGNLGIIANLLKEDYKKCVLYLLAIENRPKELEILRNAAVLQVF